MYWNIPSEKCIVLIILLLLQLAERRKGNDAYRARDYKTALHHYERAKSVVDLVQGLSQADQIEVILNKIAVNCNIAAVRLATQDYGAAVKACNDALELDPKCEKAIARRAKAYIGRHEYDLAEKDAGKLRDINMLNDDLQEIELLMKKTKLADRRSEQSFKNMFLRQ